MYDLQLMYCIHSATPRFILTVTKLCVIISVSTQASIMIPQNPSSPSLFSPSPSRPVISHNYPIPPSSNFNPSHGLYNPENEPDTPLTRFLQRFRSDIYDRIVLDINSGKIDEDGRARCNYRAEINKFLTNNLDLLSLLKLKLLIAQDLYQIHEHILSSELFLDILAIFTPWMDEQLTIELLLIKTQAIIGNIQCQYYKITKNMKYYYLGSMAISQILHHMTELRDAVDRLLSHLTTQQQESITWMILNIVKLIYFYGKPLIWLGCGKYIVDSFIYAAMVMDSVITLCTAHHLKLKLKLLTCGYEVLVTSENHDEAKNLLNYMKKVVSELRQREELDPPVPLNTAHILAQAETDLAILEVVYNFWKDNDSLVLQQLKSPVTDLPGVASSGTGTIRPLKSNATVNQVPYSYPERCLLECMRLQQLTADNPNEAWKKRSTCLMKAFMNYTNPLRVDPTPVPEVPAATNPKEKISSKASKLSPRAIQQAEQAAAAAAQAALEAEKNAENMVPTVQLSVRCLIDVLTIAMFDSLHETIDPHAILKRIHLMTSDELLPGLLEKYRIQSSNDLNDTLEINILRLLAAYTAQPTTEMGLQLLQEVNKFLHTPHLFESRIYLLRKIALSLWSKRVYPSLQHLLKQHYTADALDPSSKEEINRLLPSLLATIRIFDLTSIEDPVLMGGVTLITAQLLNLEEEYRSSISLLVKVIESIESYRSARVNVHLHAPEDFRDVKALQHQSFSCRSDNATYWHHSVKRLGAHAFAGFGIFGTASSSHQSDQALADTHTELLALYIRTELLHGIHSRRTAALFKTFSKEETSKASDKKATVKGTNSTNQKTTTLFPTSKSETTKGVTPLAIENIEKLACVKSLRSTYGKSTYHRCILCMEMARFELNPEEKKKLLNEAIQYLLDAQQREEMLIQKNDSLELISSSGSHVTPIILSRSHDCCYVCPVIPKKYHQSPIKYLRVFAREEGSGVEVSSSSDELAGCDTLLPFSSMSSPFTAAIKISNLRYGERYVFACAMYDNSDRIIGKVSSTSYPVEAVNPLPTLFLWSMLVDLSHSSGFHETTQLILPHVLEYFIKTAKPKQYLLNLGHGYNLFLLDQYFLNMLAIQQASPLQLEMFVKSALIYLQLVSTQLFQDHYFNISSIELFSYRLNWNYCQDKQLGLLNLLSKLALVLHVASYLQSEELITRCCIYCYNLINQPLKGSLLPLSSYIYPKLCLFLSSLQIIPRRHWREIHHQLYCRYLYYTINCGFITGMIDPLKPILENFVQIIQEKTEDDEPVCSCSAEALLGYCAVYYLLEMKETEFMTSDLKNSFHKILNLVQSSGNSPVAFELWHLTPIQRQYFLKSHGLSLLTQQPTDGLSADLFQELQTQFKQPPRIASQYLSALVDCVEMILKTDKHQEIIPFLQRYSIPPEMLPDELSQLCRKYRFPFIHEAINKTKESIDLESADAGDDHPQSVVFSVNEIQEEYKAMAALCRLLATNLFSDISRNDFVNSAAGPYEKIPPEVLANGIGEAYLSAESNKEIADAEAVAIAKSRPPSPVLTQPPAKGKGAAKDQPPPPQSPRTPPLPAFTSVDYLKYLAISAIMFIRGEYYQSAVDASALIWKFVMNKWITPLQFAKDYAVLRSTLLLLYESYVTHLQVITHTVVVETTNITTTTTITTTPSFHHPQDVKLTFLLLKDLLIYLTKVITLLSDYHPLVTAAIPILQLYYQHAPEYAKNVSDGMISSLLHSQEQLIAETATKITAREENLATFINDWTELQKKKNRKKLRIARTEKTEEELEFEYQRGVLEEKLQKTRDLHTSQCEVKENIQNIEKRVESLMTSGQQLAEKITRSKEVFMMEIRQFVQAEQQEQQEQPEQESSDHMIPYQILHREKHLLKKYQEIQSHYRQVASFLREKKERLCLLNTLHEQGDMLIYFHQHELACSVWRDGIDGLFNILDVWKEWRGPLTSILATKVADPVLVQGALPTMMVLAKLSHFCTSKNLELRSNYCQMAATVCYLLFKDTVGHPTQPYGFATYICRELNGITPFDFQTGSTALKPASVQLCCNEILRILYSEKKFLEALPVVVFLEYFHGTYTRRIDKWYEARCCRIKLLLGLHYFAEAVSMMSDILPSIHEIASGAYSSPLQIIRKREAKYPRNIYGNGLDYHDAPPYFNQQTPYSADNKTSIQWMINFPHVFEKESQKYVACLPPVIKSPEEIAADEQKKAAEKAAAEAEAAKKGAKKGKEKEEVTAPPPPVEVNTLPIFSKFHYADLSLLAAQFLLELISLNPRACTEHAKDKEQLQVMVQNLLETAATILSVPPTTPPSAGEDEEQKLSKRLQSYMPHPYEIPSYLWTNPIWISLYRRCHQHSVQLQVIQRDYKSARASILTLLHLLSSLPPLGGHAKYEVTQLWFEMKASLIYLAECQARYEDGIQVATQGMKEADSITSTTWQTEYLYQRSKLLLKIGNLDDAERDCTALLDQLRSQRTSLVVQASMLISSILHLKKQTSDYRAAVRDTMNSLKYLRKALSISQELAKAHGFFTGDLNLTYSSDGNMVMKHDQYPPLLHSLTPIYNNFPDIFNYSKYLPSSPSKASSGASSYLPSLDGILKVNQSLRAGPIDLKETYPSSIPFANIYLVEIKLLSCCYASLCELVDEVRVAHIPWNIMKEYDHEDGNNHAEEVKEEKNYNESLFSEESLLKEQLTCGEEGLKVRGWLRLHGLILSRFYDSRSFHHQRRRLHSCFLLVRHVLLKLRRMCLEVRIVMLFPESSHTD